MPFKKSVDGRADPNRNNAGRIPKKDKETPRKIKEKELISLLRKIKPNLALAIATVVNTMKNEDATEAGKLKAAALMLQYYKELIKDVYGVELELDEDTPDDVDGNKAPVFSMKMIDSEGNVVK